MKLILISLFIVNCLIIAESSCPSDTSKWCSSVEISKDCDVFDQCLKNVWQPINPFLDHKLIKINFEDADLVNFTLYYESLCPDCRGFMSGQLWKAYQSISSIMNLTIVPYGNAKENYDNKTDTWQFTCQHGDDECYGNLLHTCFIYYYPKTDDHLPFIHCMESDNSDNIKDAATKCSNELSIKLDQVYDCMGSKLGNLLQHQNAQLTEALNPPHKYVPWVTLNGEHTETIESLAEKDLVKLICSTYKGTNKPPACKK